MRKATNIPVSIVLRLVLIGGGLAATGPKAIATTAENTTTTEAKTSKSDPSELRVYWRRGLNLASADGSVKINAGGLYQGDWTWVDTESPLTSSVGLQNGGTEARRARLKVRGQVNDSVAFKLQFDFAGGEAKLKDAFLGFRDSPLGEVRLGHFKEPFSIEQLTSAKYITFIERSLPTQAFAPSRNAGLMLFDSVCKGRASWALGVFRPTDNFGHMQDDSGHSVTGRVSLVPVFRDKGACLVHVGAAYSYRNNTLSSSLGGDAARFRARPEAHLLDRFVDTGTFLSPRVQLIGLEAAAVSGPLSVQGEYMMARAEINSHADFSGFYVQTSYILTGERRRYRDKTGVFGRVQPQKNYHQKTGGKGAWELAARYSSLDLNDAGITGGKLEDYTAGVNWYLNPTMRLMFNYIRAELQGVGGADIGLMRVQVGF